MRDHLRAGLDYQSKLARFLENHDEPRAAGTFARDAHQAAAAITFLSPGLRFFHQGQFEGRTKRISPHLCRAPEEPVDQELSRFYQRLLDVLRPPLLRDAEWQLIESAPAWDGNWTWDCFVAFAWQGRGDQRLLVAVNYASHQSQCYLRLPIPDLRSRRWILTDLMSTARYERDGDGLVLPGLYVDVGPWQYHVFELNPS